MASSTNSMLSSFFLFAVTLSLQEMYRGKLASSELFTILSGFFIGNFQESSGARTGWGAVILVELVALIAAGTVHRVCITTWTPEKLHTWIRTVLDAYHFSREGTLIREARDLMNPKIIEKLEELKALVEKTSCNSTRPNLSAADIYF